MTTTILVGDQEVRQARRLLGALTRPRVRRTLSGEWVVSCLPCATGRSFYPTWVDAMEAAYGHLCMTHGRRS